jgi:hypothetical protein
LTEFIDVPTGTPAPPEPEKKPRVPADYYNSPPGDLRPIVPRGMLRGCGWISGALLLIGFVGGFVIMEIGLAKPMAFVLNESAGEMQKMFAPDVTPAQKKTLNDELDRLAKNLESGTTPVGRLQPVLNGIRDAIADQKVTPAETESLTKIARDANAPAPPKPAKK